MNSQIVQTAYHHATAARLSAHAPYSRFLVGACFKIKDQEKYVSGCNVENASYGVGLCAECGLVSNLISTGGGRLIAVVCVDGQGNYLAPCGRCRQLLFEHGGPEALLMTDDGPQKMSAMLPWAFGPDDLDRNER